MPCVPEENSAHPNFCAFAVGFGCVRHFVYVTLARDVIQSENCAKIVLCMALARLLETIYESCVM